MLTVLLGFHLAAHLMTAQAIKGSFTQTLVPNEFNRERVVIVQWEWNPIQ